MLFDILGPATAAIAVILYLWCERHIQSVDRIVRVHNSPEAAKHLASRIDHSLEVFYMLSGCACSTLNAPIVLDSFREAHKRKVDTRIIILHPEVFVQQADDKTILNLSEEEVLQVAIAPQEHENLQHFQISDISFYLEDHHLRPVEEGCTEHRTGIWVETASAAVLNPLIGRFLELWNQSPKFGGRGAPDITTRLRQRRSGQKEQGSVVAAAFGLILVLRMQLLRWRGRSGLGGNSSDPKKGG